MTTLNPDSAASNGAPVGALSTSDAFAEAQYGGDAYVLGSWWSAKWSPNQFRTLVARDNAAITGTISVVWTWLRLEATTETVTVRDSYAATSTIAAGAARASSSTTSTVTAPGAGWSTLDQLHDLEVAATLGGSDDAHRVALQYVRLSFTTPTAAATGTAPVVTVSHPPASIPRSLIRPRVTWEFDCPYGYDQAAYRVKVFAGAPSPDADTDPAPLYDSGEITSDVAAHDLLDALDWTAGPRLYVKAKNATEGTWSAWAYRTVTSEPTVVASAPTVTAPNGAYTGDPVPTLTVPSLSPQFASTGLAAVQVRGYVADSTATPDDDEADIDLWGEVTWSANQHPDPSFEAGDLAATVVVSGGSVTTSTTQRRTGRRSLQLTLAGGTDGFATFGRADVARTNHHVVTAWVWAPVGTAYTWGWQTRSTDLTTVLTTTASGSGTGTGTWQRHTCTGLQAGGGDCRVGFYLVSAAASGTLIYCDDVEILSGTPPTLTCADPLVPGVVTYWHCRAIARSGLATGWGTSNTTPDWDASTPTASAATATCDATYHRVNVAVTRAAGYTGSARLETQRSDDSGTTWVDVYGSGTSTWALAATGDSVTVYDWAAPPATSPQYRYRLVGYADTAQPKPHSWVSLSLTGGPLRAEAWLKDVVTTARNLQLNLQVAGFRFATASTGAQWRPLGVTLPTVTVASTGGDTVNATLLVSGTDRTALETLRTSERTLLLQTQWGAQWWGRLVGTRALAPIPTADRATTTREFVAVTFQQVDQPEAS